MDRTDGERGAFAARLVEESPDALVALSEDGTVLTWNRGAEAMFGFAAAEAIATKLEALVVPPELRQEAREALTDVIERGEILIETRRKRRACSRRIPRASTSSSSLSRRTR